MRYKSWALAFVILTFGGTLGLGVGNYLLDPFGLRSVEGKNFYNLSKAEFSYMYPVKIAQKAPYYLVGSSRTWYLNLPRLSHYLNTHIIRVGMANQSLDESLLLLHALKANSGHFIAGFDAFALSTARLPHNRLQQEFAKDTHHNTISFLLNPRTTQALLRVFKYKILKRPNDWYFTYENLRIGKTSSHERIEEHNFLKPNPEYKGAQFEHYDIDQSKILELARLGDSQDIFIIFPKYAYYYELFARYGVQEPYFRAIEILVGNTKARVFSFYGNNSITCDKDNFDDYAWHLKPKVGDLILARIFDDGTKSLPEDFGVELTQSNIHSYLQSLRKQIRSNPCKSTESKITESK